MTPDVHAYWNWVFVFTSAWVGAACGTTGAVKCLTEERLRGFIENQRNRDPLTPKQVQQIADAFWLVATKEQSRDNSPKFINTETEVEAALA